MSTKTLLDSGQVIRNSFDEPNNALRVTSVDGDFNIEITANLYKHISTNTTTLVKTGPGVLSSVVINKAGASANIATVYDGIDATGTVIAIIDTTVARPLEYNVAYLVGLTIVTATGTAADLTINYT